MKERRRHHNKRDPETESALRLPVTDFPAYLVKCLDTYKIGKETIQLSLKLDTNMDFTFGEVWILVTLEEICILTGEYVKGKGWLPGTYHIYPREDYEHFASENLPTSSIITAVHKETGERIVLTRYSNAKAKEVASFIKLLGVLYEKGVIEPEDLRDIPGGPGGPDDPGRNGGHAGPGGPPGGPGGPGPGGGPGGPRPGGGPEKKVNKKKVFMRLLSYAKQYRMRIVIVLLLILLASLMQVIYPYVSGKVYMDEVLSPTGKYYGMVAQLVLVMIAVQGATLFLNALSGRFNAKFAADVIYKLKTETFQAMQRLSIKFFTDRETGNLMTRINNDSEEVQWFFIDGLPYMIFNLANLVGVVVLMFVMSSVVSLLVMIPVPFILLFMRTFMPKFHKMYKKSHRRRSDMNSRMNDSFTGVKVVKAFGKEDQEVARFEQTSRNFADVEKKIEQTAETLFPTIHLLMWLGSLGIYIFGGIQILEGHILFGDLTAMVAYVGMLYNPLQWFTRLVRFFSRAMQAANRVFEVMDSESQVPERKHPVELSEVKGEVCLDHVCFSYEPNVPILTDISLTVQPGEVIGVVGHSGAGKSTLINLITRLYDVDSGLITIDGVNIKDLSFHCLRKNIAMVLQDTYLFTGTVMANIAYAKPEANMEEIIAAAKEACAHDFIMNLTDGYDTYIGGGGQGLSGGERQRLALARAILMNPKILILDEATSAVDTKTEMDIQSAMEKFSQGRTTFNIAHRLSTLRNADRLIVIDGGKLVECGTHRELCQIEDGVYRRLYDIQKEALKVRGIETDGSELSGYEQN